MRAESAQVLSDLGTASHVAIAIGLRASYAEPKTSQAQLETYHGATDAKTIPAQATEASKITNHRYSGKLS